MPARKKPLNEAASAGAGGAVGYVVGSGIGIAAFGMAASAALPLAFVGLSVSWLGAKAINLAAENRELRAKQGPSSED